MVTIKEFYFRLANQMFQIAAAYGIAGKLQDQAYIPEGWVYQNVFSGPFFTSKTISSKYIFKEPSFTYNESPIPPTYNPQKDSYSIDGYYQSEKNFINVEQKIRQIFSPNEEINNYINNKYSHIINNEKTCSIHIRRGDYLNLSQYHTNLDMNYYMKAIKMFPKDTVFIIFSDDIMWCKETFPPSEKFIHIENEADYVDMFLMSKCTNNIIANSSFSWWGAWLNENKNKRVIAPNKWFGPSNSHLETKDIYFNGIEQI